MSDKLKNMNENLIPLESVGCFIDEKTGMTYPMNNDNTPDMSLDVFIEDCTDEWFMSLSPMDNSEVQDIRINIGTYPNS